MAENNKSKKNPVDKVEEKVIENDDRKEEVVIQYGSVKTDHGGQRVYIKEKLPKKEILSRHRRSCSIQAVMFCKSGHLPHP